MQQIKTGSFLHGYGLLPFKFKYLIKVLHADHQRIGIDAVLAAAADIMRLSRYWV